MRILITTPLYPPDIAPSATYVKELARRLSFEHKVAILAYGHLPEEINSVEIKVVNKRKMLLLRLIKYTIALFSMASKADIIYSENGPSVELPLGIFRLLKRKALILHIGDKEARKYSENRSYLRLITRFIGESEVVTDTPIKRPEILPFDEVPSAEISRYEESWKKHVRLLNNIFEKHAK